MSIGTERKKSTSVWYAIVTGIGFLIARVEGRDAEVDGIRIWHPASRLPTPGIPLRLRLRRGRVINGMRPGYIERRDVQDLGYRDTKDRVIADVIEWAIR